MERRGGAGLRGGADFKNRAERDLENLRGGYRGKKNLHKGIDRCDRIGDRRVFTPSDAAMRITKIARIEHEKDQLRNKV